MGNCLITQLKGAVQNENLPHFGYSQIPLIATAASEDTYIINNANQELGIRLIGDGYLIDENNNNVGKVAPANTKITKIGSNSANEMILEIPTLYLANINSQEFSLDKNYNTSKIHVKSFDLNILERTFVNPYNTFKCNVMSNKYYGNVGKVVSGKKFSNIVIRSYNGTSLFNDTECNINEDWVIPNNIWPYTISLDGLTGVYGNLNDFITDMAQKTGTIAEGSTIKVVFELVNMPNLQYNGASIGNRFVKRVTINPDKSWSIN